MFGFFKKNKAPVESATAESSPVPTAAPAELPIAQEPVRTSWVAKLKRGLSKTSSSLTTLFTGTRIDEALYEELETALLMADTGVDATNYLLTQLKERVKQGKLAEPAQVKEALENLLVQTLAPLEKGLPIVG